jgi:hypothetical protein
MRPSGPRIPPAVEPFITLYQEKSRPLETNGARAGGIIASLPTRPSEPRIPPAVEPFITLHQEKN